MSPDRSLKTTALVTILFACALSPACGRDDSGGASTDKSSAARGSHVAAKAPAPEPEPAELPRGATAGDVLPPLPTAARRLSGGVDALPLLPSVTCASLAPDREFKLGPRLEIVRLPRKKGEPAGTLEVCLFNRWLKRTADELPERTGRVHHLVAAFPGDEVAAWTSDELKRPPANARPEWSLPKAAGWSAVIATGIPDRPALAVVSARFYDGPLAEELHWRRHARILRRSKGRWAWVPLASLHFTSLDTTHLLAACQREETEGDEACLGADERVEAHRRDGASRGEVRQARVARRKDAKRARKKRRDKSAKTNEVKRYRGDSEPQAAWLHDGRAALARGKWRLALQCALRIDMACGEPVRESRDLIAAALKKAGIVSEKSLPLARHVPLCEPLPDKPGPKRQR